MKSKICRNPYLLFILLILGAFLIFSIWSARQAATRGTEISDPLYYSKGLKYNLSQAEAQNATGEGWQLETKFAAKILRFHLSDLNGNPIQQATGRFTLYLNHPDQELNLPAREEQPGIYLTRVPETIRGSLSAKIEFSRQGARLSRRLLVNF
jgi:nitrogen fixation protein FixH